MEVINQQARELASGCYCLMECVEIGRMSEAEPSPETWYDPGETIHAPNSAYLMIGDDRTLLFDTLSHASTEFVVSEIERVLGERPLDYLVPSHTEAPHAGNAGAVLEANPEAELVGAKQGTRHGMVHLDEALLVEPGDEIELGGRRIEFVDPVFIDDAMTVWAFDHGTRTLFSVDWLGYLHADDMCNQFSDELPAVSLDQLLGFHAHSLDWLRFADPGKIEAAVEDLLDRFDPAIIAPAHGNVVRHAPIEHARLVYEVIERMQADEPVEDAIDALAETN